ncbi:MAG: hypothetical protein L6Q99_05250 [Planctomycetes bacterium]|nr:hypothetical protein [Planctomycetota bacterium]
MNFEPHSSRGDGEPFPGARWLRGKSAKEIFERLLAAKELELGARVAARLESRAVLLDPERTLMRSIAHIARRARVYEGDPPLEEFLQDGVDRGIDDLIEEDVEAERSQTPIADETRYQAVCAVLGSQASDARRICVVLNTQADELRHAAFAVLVQRKTLDEHARATSISRERTRELVRESLRRLSRAFGRTIDPTDYGL